MLGPVFFGTVMIREIFFWNNFLFYIKSGLHFGQLGCFVNFSYEMQKIKMRNVKVILNMFMLFSEE